MNTRQTIRVRDVMQSGVGIVDGMATVRDALQKMKHIDSKALIVNKRHEDDEYGIVLLSDIARQVMAKDKSPQRVNIYEIMSKPVISVDCDMDIRYCARLFDRVGLSRAPVLHEGKVVGIVSYTDMVMKGLFPNM